MRFQQGLCDFIIMVYCGSPADALCKNVLIPTIYIRLVIDQMSEVTPSTIINVYF